MLKPTTFVAAMKDFFGLRPGQNLSGFSEEVKALSPVDREYFRIGLNQNGYAIPPV